MNPAIFREYDIRGVAARDLDDKTVLSLGRAFGTWLQRRGRREALVGMDNRLSSPRLKEALMEGLLSTGCRVVDLGTVITPLFYYARELYGVDGGVMITGSHNPPDENGFKLACGPGTIYGEEIQSLRRLMENGDFVTGRGTLDGANPAPEYLAMLAEKIRLGPKKPKVAVDCGNGTAALFAVDFLTSLGCTVIPLYCKPDGHFPHHHPDPVKRANLTTLVETVRKEGAGLGIAFDGDGDRLGAVDDTGRVIWGDQLMALFWREILPKHPGAVAIIEVKCSQGLVDEVKRLGGRPYFYRTGHSLIKARMRELGAVFTGEMSGHMFFADEYYGFDDAFYAAGRLLRLLSNSQESFSALVDTLPRYHSTAETRVPCSDREKFAVVQRLTALFREKYEVIDVDGVRVQFPGGWGLVRASNTQPVLVARCEAATGEELDRITEIMRQALLNQPEVAGFQWEY
ncbi:phosphomannomutase [Desulfotomaculum copahuensis]|uniref:Phosphomannomutase n=1 Tax=Desulfotomaculum copahuensis TaxID=1838280 RepID=A0A1B7LHS2_9FIRM|nr:phosphomannomutase/phosphoglucomutase [Desulfotomaculum copahuensis]OAT85827.1 phosphomannomutase [Desulfotomaculum copahuensis]